MRKVADEKQDIKSVVSVPISKSVFEDLKGSEEVESEVEKERPCSSKVHDSVAYSVTKTVVTGEGHTGGTSDLGEETLSSAVKGTDQTETMVPHESSKDCNIEESGVLLDVDGKVCGDGSREIFEKGVTAYKPQSVSSEERRVLTSKKIPSLEDDEYHSSQRELKSVVIRVTAEANPEGKRREAEHHSHSESSCVRYDEVSPVQQETKETGDSPVESHGDFLDSSIQTSQDRKCTGTDEETKGSASRKLSKEAEKSEHEIRKSHTLLTDFKDDGVNGCEKAEHSSVSYHKPNSYHKENALQNRTGSGVGVADCKGKVTEVGKTLGQSLGESKLADETQTLGELADGSAHSVLSIYQVIYDKNDNGKMIKSYVNVVPLTYVILIF
jgi:hypothetical protein